MPKQGTSDGQDLPEFDGWQQNFTGWGRMLREVDGWGRNPDRSGPDRMDLLDFDGCAVKFDGFGPDGCGCVPDVDRFCKTSVRR